MQPDFEPTAVDLTARPGAGKRQPPVATVWIASTVRRLAAAWAAVAMSCAVLALAAGTLSDPQPDLGMAFLAGLLALVLMTLAVWLGGVVRRSGQALERGLIDEASGLYNLKGLADQGDALLAACQRERRPVAMAVFDCADLLEVHSIYGERTAGKLRDCLVRKLLAVAGERGLAARTGPAQFTLLLPGMGREKAMASIHKALGSPSRIEFDVGHSEIVLVPEIAVEGLSDDRTSAREALRALSLALQQDREREERRQRYLRRERERHSRPMGLEALPRPRASRAGRADGLVPTMPAPLSAG